MTFDVDVDWPGHHCHGILTDEHPRSSGFRPVLVFCGQAYGPAALMPNLKITATWRKARTGPVWDFIQKAIDAGYPIEVHAIG